MAEYQVTMSHGCSVLLHASSTLLYILLSLTLCNYSTKAVHIPRLEETSPNSMGKEYSKKITWVINNFSSLQSQNVCSDHFVVNGCRWYLKAYPQGDKVDKNSLSLYLKVANSGSLSSGWRRHARYFLTLVNQNSEKNIQRKEIQHWFAGKSNGWGHSSMLPLNELHAQDSGFLVNGELKIVAEIEVLEVIGKLDVIEETSTLTETVDVNGFQLLPSQAKIGRIMFERHPEFASELRSKNPNLRTAYMSLLLSLVETTCQLPRKISKDVISDTYAALGSMKHAGFKLDWLEKKLDEMLEKKEKNQASETRLQEMEQELKGLKRKWSDMEALVDKEKGKVLAAKAPLSLDDVV